MINRVRLMILNEIDAICINAGDTHWAGCRKLAIKFCIFLDLNDNNLSSNCRIYINQL